VRIERDDLPAHWGLITMGDIAKVVGGSTPKSKEPSYWDGDIPWLGVSDLTGYTERYISRGARSITQEGYDSSSTQMVPAGTVLFSSRAPIGYVAIAQQPLCTSQGFKSFVLQADVNPEYVYWYLRYAKSIAEQMASGTTFKEISGKAAAKIPIPIPPRAEQDDIVSRLDAIAAGIEAGRAAFRRARESTTRYRASCMAAAFAVGGDPCTLDDVAEIQSGIAKGRKGADATAEVPYIRTANVQAGRLDLSVIKLLAVTPEQRRRHALRTNDVLVLEGGDADKVGRGWLWEGQIQDCLHQNHVFAVRPREGLMLPRWFAYYINAPQARRYFLACAKQTTNLASINKGQLKSLPLELPPISVQASAVAMLDRQMVAIAEQEKRLDSHLSASDDLLRSACHFAFSGRLGIGAARAVPAEENGRAVRAEA
jgi:type I restriction enzyme, S subunit